MFELGEQVILNEKIKKDYPSVCGELATITRIITSSPNFQFDIELPNGDYTPVRECEIDKLTDKQKELITYIYNGNELLYTPTNEIVEVLKVDWLHNKVEVEFYDGGLQVVNIEKLSKIEKEIGSVENSTNESICEKLLKVFLGHYKNSDDTYTVPKELLIHILEELYTEKV